MSRGKLLNTNLSNITSDVSDLQLGLQSAEDSITNAFEVSAPIEKSPSTHNYAVGDYLIWNGALRRVTSAISVGDALTNSNTTLTNSGKELSQINADLSVSSFASEIETYNGVTITRAVKYGKNIEIVGKVPANMVHNTRAFKIPSNLEPNQEILVTPCVRNGCHGVVTYNRQVIANKEFCYFTDSQYNLEQNFNITYIID